MSDENEIVPESRDPLDLRALTPARVALDRTGSSLTTRHALEFSLAHAQARDAVHSALAVSSLLGELRARNLVALAVKSAASDRTEYLLRPDLGRTLATAAAERVAQARIPPAAPGATMISITLADGLSALAVERHALPLLDVLLPLLRRQTADYWTIAPVVIAEQGRVALGDEIGAALAADVSIMLIGERPGLSSPASLGAYITWGPRPGRTNAERNCISNIRSEGLDYAAAANKIAMVLQEARRLQLTGVKLRDGASADFTHLSADTATGP